ncbi:MAG: MFS transporter [Nitrososphaerota archaeon]
MAVSMRTTLRTLPRPMWALVFGTFLNRFGDFVYVFLVLYLTQHGYTAPQAGLAIGAYGVGGLVAAVLGGRLTDRYGRRNAIVASMCGSAVSVLTLSQTHGLFLIVLLAGAAGLAAELYRPASNALVADLMPEDQRVTGFALYRLAINAGAAAGPAVAGFLVGHSFFLLFLGDAVTSLLFAIVAFVALPNRVSAQHVERAAPKTSGERVHRVAVTPYKPRFLLLLTASALTSYVYAQSNTTLGLQVRVAGLSAMVYGGLLSLNGLLIIMIELPLTSYTRKMTPHRAITVGSVLIALGFGFTAFASSVGLLAFSVVLWTFGEMVLSPVRAAYVANLAPAAARGRYLGTLGIARSLGRILASVLGTVLFTWNTHAFWLLCGLVGIVAAIIVFVTQRPAVPYEPKRDVPQWYRPVVRALLGVWRWLSRSVRANGQHTGSGQPPAEECRP